MNWRDHYFASAVLGIGSAHAAITFYLPGLNTLKDRLVLQEGLLFPGVRREE